jgi:acetyl-CoA carboxylase biotin carboxyl carrier protein
MELEFIKRLIDLFERSSLLELDYVDGDERIRLSRSAGEDGKSAAISEISPVRTPILSAPDLGVADRKPVSNKHAIAAGLVGTFFRRPSPEKEPFVGVGDMVQEGQTLALLEAMKMLIPVECDRSGRIAEILPEDGTLIEAGTPLFIIEPLD